MFEQITKAHEAQLTHFLRATKAEVGLILAFGERGQFKGFVLTNDRKRFPWFMPTILDIRSYPCQAYCTERRRTHRGSNRVQSI